MQLAGIHPEWNFSHTLRGMFLGDGGRGRGLNEVTERITYGTLTQAPTNQRAQSDINCLIGRLYV